MKTLSNAAIAAAMTLLIAPSAANAAVFDILLNAGPQSGSGTITINDSLIKPNAVVRTQDTKVQIKFAGYDFSVPYSGSSETFVFDAVGKSITSVRDVTGSFVEFGTTSGFPYLQLSNGPVPGFFRTNGLNNDVTGTFSIAAQSAAVPEPATWAMMMLGFSMVGYAVRRRKVTFARA